MKKIHDKITFRCVYMHLLVNRAALKNMNSCHMSCCCQATLWWSKPLQEEEAKGWGSPGTTMRPGIVLLFLGLIQNFSSIKLCSGRGDWRLSYWEAVWHEQARVCLTLWRGQTLEMWRYSAEQQHGWKKHHRPPVTTWSAHVEILWNDMKTVQAFLVLLI